MLLCASLAGCVAQYPMGLSREQWDALNPTQQAEYQAKQYAIDAQARQQAATQRAERERMAAEQAAQERARIRQLYENARYGDIVHVTVQGGSLEYNGKRYPYEPVSFDLVKGEKKEVAFYGRGMNTIATRYNVRLTDDGNTLYFDDSFRSRIVMVNENWERGQTYRPEGTRNDVTVGIAGMTFFVKLKELPGAPHRVIIERR
jgi:hypothetical protein